MAMLVSLIKREMYAEPCHSGMHSQDVTQHLNSLYVEKHGRAFLSQLLDIIIKLSKLEEIGDEDKDEQIDR